MTNKNVMTDIAQLLTAIDRLAEEVKADKQKLEALTETLVETMGMDKTFVCEYFKMVLVDAPGEVDLDKLKADLHAVIIGNAILSGAVKLTLTQLEALMKYFKTTPSGAVFTASPKEMAKAYIRRGSGKSTPRFKLLKEFTIDMKEE